MSRSILAFFIAILIHIILLLLFYIFVSMAPPKQQKTQEKKLLLSLKEFTKPIPKKQELGPIPKKPPEVVPPLPKGSQLKKIVKEPIVYEQKKVKKTPTLNQQKVPTTNQKKTPTKQKTVEKIPEKKSYIPLTQKKQENPKDMGWLFEDRSMYEKENSTVKRTKGASAGKDIKELYGDDFGKLSAGQQEYILDNMEIMRRITQEVLNRQASVSNINNIRVNRSNVIEFYLHPNGNMSDFKFLQKSGYYVLDSITQSTIEFAYSKYPFPKEKTLIRYNVFYYLK